MTYRKRGQAPGGGPADPPRESLVLETDAPDLTPEPYRGRANEPAFLVEIARKVAEIKGITVAEVAGCNHGKCGAAVPDLERLIDKAEVHLTQNAEDLKPEVSTSNSLQKSSSLLEEESYSCPISIVFPAPNSWSARKELTKLKESTVAVFGLGGVGGFAAEALCRAGIGRLIIVDFDDICLTNVNRQIHAMDGTVGRAKAQVMAERMRLINPAGRYRSLQGFLCR